MSTTSPDPWHRRLVQFGPVRAQVLITGFSVVASVAAVALFYLVFGGTRKDALSYFVPAVMVPAVVAPLASRHIVRLAFELDAARATVAAQAARLSALMTAAPVGIIELDRTGSIRTANDVAESLLGAEGVTPAWSARFVEAEAHDGFMRRLAAGEAATALRWRWRMPAGGERVVEAHMAPASGAPGQEGAVLVLADITEQEALDEAMARTRQLELVGRLAAGLAHDFNNLLTIIKASAEAIRGGETGAPVEAIESAAQRGSRMTRRLLAISRRDGHAPTAQPVAPLVAEMLDLVTPLLPETLRLERPGPIPDLTVMVDRDAVQQALMNLVLNARDALDGRGTMRLAVRVQRLEGREWLVLGVHDNGPGMSPEVLARATEAFFTTKATHLGTGLGLSLVQETMQRHGGQLALSSIPGLGTVAELWFPDPVPIPRATPEPTSVAPGEGERTLLLVDDDPLVRHMTRKILGHLGYEVLVAGDAAEARRHLAAQPVSLIVSDVMMPGETGLEMLRRLRAEGSEVPVLLVSGYSAESVAAAIVGDPRAAFLAKPWGVAELQERLAALL